MIWYIKICRRREERRKEEKIINKVISKNAKVVDEYKGGKVQVLGFLVGQVMKETRGQANPSVVNDLFKRKLG